MSLLTLIGLGMFLVPIGLVLVAAALFAVHDAIYGPDRAGAIAVLGIIWLIASSVVLLAGLLR